MEVLAAFSAREVKRAAAEERERDEYFSAGPEALPRSQREQDKKNQRRSQERSDCQRSDGEE